MAEHKEQFKNYRVGEIIGRGRFAVVYRAEKHDIRKPVALKVLNPEYAHRTDVRDQFREQAKQQAKLTHPRLVRVEDLREEHGQFFVAMEYMPLGSLRSWVTRNGMLSFRQTAIIIEDAAEALDYLHGRSLVHGDVQPGNILLMDDPNQKNVLRAKLSDLRLPLKAEVSQTVSDNLVEITPEYISPEQASGKQTTPLSDQYSLGVVAYEMLCGQPPFTNKSQVDLYIDHQKTRPPSLQQLNNQITPELEQVVLRALEKSPANRYSSCGEFARALRAAVAATEQKRLTDLLNSAERLLEKQEFGQANVALKDALLIQPENERAIQLTTRLDQQESLSKNYHQAIDALQLAEAKAQAIRKASLSEPDEAGLLKTFAPPPPPFWKQIAERWRSARQLTATFLIFILICIAGITFWIDTAGSQTIKPTIVAMDRTSTLTITPTFTPTFTSTFTVTPTFTPTQTSTPIGGGLGKLAFISSRDGNDEIYVMNADGSGQTNLSNNSTRDYSPVWSPDGKKIAFVSIGSAIYVMNADGSDLTEVIANPQNEADPVWSPDGKKIAFVSRGFDIYVMNADGSSPINLTYTDTLDYSPVWSPDGKKIVFAFSYTVRTRRCYSWGCFTRTATFFDINVMNADGSNRMKLTDNKGAKTPIWSPDGNKIAFFTNNEVYVMNTDGSGQTNLSNSDGGDSSPAWSPDGKTIAFVSYRDGNHEIYVTNVDSSNPTNLTNNGGRDYDPVWSPDGKKIAFVSNRDGNNEIYVINADGSGLTNLSNNSASDTFPVWSP